MRLEHVDLEAGPVGQSPGVVEQALEREEALRAEADDRDAEGAARVGLRTRVYRSDGSDGPSPSATSPARTPGGQPSSRVTQPSSYTVSR